MIRPDRARHGTAPEVLEPARERLPAQVGVPARRTGAEALKVYAEACETTVVPYDPAP
ncbi:hypothetical protein [Streptomyces bikiniensis]|uniref:hypothetical protein n=1 Tax=Streptomyces bikiniensis TaxID=1896 RepID=UPI000A7C6658|nr:hypothetical protein [Streptomyces bikiniensis]